MSANHAGARKLRVFLASSFIDAVEAAYDASFDVTRADKGTVGGPLADLARRAAAGERFDALLFSLDLRLDVAAIEALPSEIRALATYSVGTDHIDLDAAAARGLATFNTPGVLADSVAENALFLMLGAARRATQSIGLLRDGKWQGWTPTQLVGVQLSGRTLGIAGMGDIGTRVARRAHALGMKILYWNRRPAAAAAELGAEYRDSAERLFAESDVVLLACPSTDETRGLVDDALLSHARPGLILVNIARGNLVRDDALIAALADGRVWAAGLDVFDGEPRVDARYFDLPNVFMLPHIGSSTLEARVGMGRILITALQAWQAGHSVENRVV